MIICVIIYVCMLYILWLFLYLYHIQYLIYTYIYTIYVYIDGTNLVSACGVTKWLNEMAQKKVEERFEWVLNENFHSPLTLTSAGTCIMMCCNILYDIVLYIVFDAF